VPNIDRPLSGRALHFRLGEEHPDLIDGGLLARAGRSARTLVKDGPLRVTLVALGAGGGLREHQADGPITVHVVSGQIRFRAGEDEWTLEEGDLLSLGSGVPHSVESASGGVFLLTVATAPQQGSPRAPDG
jgi:quercetin dioxygenase-like cupin family protein